MPERASSPVISPPPGRAGRHPWRDVARLGLDLRRRSPFRHTFLIGLANEEIGYLPDLQAYKDGGYQTWVGQHCAVAPGTGGAMVEQALAMLQEMYDGRDKRGPDHAL